MCEPIAEAGKNDNQNERLLSIRFEYAWRYFEFHAKQRTTMFNFFLVFSGFFVGACVKLLDLQQNELVMIILCLGLLITTFFIRLDKRNVELVHIAEDVLNDLEEKYLFKDYEFDGGKKREEKILHKLAKDETFPSRVGILNREIIKNSKNLHGTWLPRIQFLIFVMYLIMFIYNFIPFLEKFLICMKG